MSNLEGGRGARIPQRCGSQTPAVLRNLRGPSLPRTRGLHPCTRYPAPSPSLRRPLPPLPRSPRLHPASRPAPARPLAAAAPGQVSVSRAAAQQQRLRLLPGAGCPCPCPAIPHTPPPGVRSPADVALCQCSILLQPPGEYRRAGRPPRGPCHRPAFLRAPALGDARTGKEPARLHRQPAVRGALPAERLLERGVVVFVNGGFYSSLTSPRAPRVWVRRGGGAVPASPPCRSIAGLRAGNVCLGVKSMRFPSIKVSLSQLTRKIPYGLG